MSDHNPSDSFDSHPENSGCSNDDFEQLEAPGSYYHDNGDADGPDAVGSGRDYDYDFQYDTELGGEVSTTTNAGEDEAEADRYAAGASEAEAHTYTGYTPESLISFGDEDGGFDLEPSAPVPDIMEPAIAFASTKAADILSTIAPSASPPSSHFEDYTEPISSTSYDHDDGYDFKVTPREVEKQATKEDSFEFDAGKFAEETPKGKVADFYEVPDPRHDKYAEPVSCTSSDDIQTNKKIPPVAASSEEKAKGSFLKGVDPREINDEEAEVTMPSPFLKDLVYWRDVKKTGIILGAMLVVLLSLALMSVISVVAYLSLAVLTGTFSFVVYKKVLGAVRKSGDGHPFTFLLDLDISLNEDKLKSVIQTTLKNVNATTKELRHLFLVEDTVDSIKFGVLLWALTYIGSWFSDMALIIIAIVLLFTVPKLYETYQVQIDSYIALAKAQINNYLCIIQSKLPFLKKKEKTH